MHVLVGVGGDEGARRDVGVEPVQRVEHAGEGVVVEQAGGVQDAGVRPGALDVVPGQPPVEVGALRQRGERVGRDRR